MEKHRHVNVRPTKNVYVVSVGFVQDGASVTAGQRTAGRSGAGKAVKSSGWGDSDDLFVRIGTSMSAAGVA
jgi:hypothetical protein